jgi:hypothetical protein
LLMDLVLALHEKFLDHAWETVKRSKRGSFRRLYCLHREDGNPPGKREAGASG